MYCTSTPRIEHSHIQIVWGCGTPHASLEMPFVRVCTLQIRSALYAAHTKVIDFFKMCDDDGSGTISKAEFDKALRELGLTHVPESATRAVYDSFDANGDGQLDYPELQALLHGSVATHPRLKPKEADDLTPQQIDGADVLQLDAPPDESHGAEMAVTKLALPAPRGPPADGLNALQRLNATLTEDRLDSVPHRARAAIYACRDLVVGCLRLLDENASGVCSQGTFRAALEDLGLVANDHHMETVWRAILPGWRACDDASGASGDERSKDRMPYEQLQHLLQLR